MLLTFQSFRLRRGLVNHIFIYLILCLHQHCGLIHIHRKKPGKRNGLKGDGTNQDSGCYVNQRSKFRDEDHK